MQLFPRRHTGHHVDTSSRLTSTSSFENLANNALRNANVNRETEKADSARQ